MDYRGVPGLMLGNLKAQELLNRCERFGVGCRDYNSTTRRYVREFIHDLVGHLFHNGNAWWSGVVDKHRYRKVTRGEGLRDVRQVHSDVVARGRVRGIFRFDLNYTTVRVQ